MRPRNERQRCDYRMVNGEFWNAERSFGEIMLPLYRLGVSFRRRACRGERTRFRDLLVARSFVFATSSVTIGKKEAWYLHCRLIGDCDTMTSEADEARILTK